MRVADVKRVPALQAIIPVTVQWLGRSETPRNGLGVWTEKGMSRLIGEPGDRWRSPRGRASPARRSETTTRAPCPDSGSQSTGVCDAAQPHVRTSLPAER